MDTVNGQKLVFSGYKVHRTKLYVAYFCSVITLGFLPLLFFWKPTWKLKLTHTSTSLKFASSILIQEECGLVYVKSVTNQYKQDGACVTSLKYFTFKKVKYVWSEESDKFRSLCGGACESLSSCASYHERDQGLSELQALQNLQLYGPNLIKVPVRPVLWLIVHEALNPFYIFQAFTCIIWFLQEYWMYTSLVMLFSVLSVGMTVYETRKQSKSLRDTMRSGSLVNVLRDGVWQEMSSEKLVPGDVIAVMTASLMECDAVLLDGLVICNESMLTGESVPISKMPLPLDKSEMLSIDTHKRHILFCGTEVVQASGSGTFSFSLAVVLRTGFYTSKGEMVRSILYPKPVDLKLYRDGMLMCAVSACLGLVAVVYVGIMYTRNQSSIFLTVVSALDILTFVVPPQLPALLTLGNIYAQRRLKNQSIYCLSNKFINGGGSLDVVCFDKTGTLTSDELHLYEIFPAVDASFKRKTISGRGSADPMEICLGTCHSLCIVNGQLVGDPVDLAMFSAIAWEPITLSQVEQLSLPVDSRKWLFYHRQADSTETGPVYAVVHQYPFSSEAQRMSSVVQCADALTLYVKGAPEKIVSLCDPRTIPAQLEEVMQSYTTRGLRVIGLAYKALEETDISSCSFTRSFRNEVENQLTFLGFVALENTMKPGSAPTIQVLKEANIRCAMVTGDNLMTALHVARECQMIGEGEQVCLVTATKHGSSEEDIEVNYECLQYGMGDDTTGKITEKSALVSIEIEQRHYAMDGKTFDILKSKTKLFDEIIEHATVFARMLPDQKVALIQKLQDLGHKVGMCGDGANDCGALKVANTGVSLSTAEASVAAPFTAKQWDITCMPQVIKEGRCALMTSYTLFKHLLATCWLMCVSVLILSEISCDLTDPQYIYSDLILNFLPTLFFGQTGPARVLFRRRPPASLIALETLGSLLVYIGLQTLFVSGIRVYLGVQPWYTPWEYTEENYTSLENTVVFMMMNVSLFLPPLVFFYGPPHQRSIFVNKWLMVCISALFAVTVLFFFQPSFIVDLFKLTIIPAKGFILVLAAASLLNLTVSIIVERAIASRGQDFFSCCLLREKMK